MKIPDEILEKAEHFQESRMADEAAQVIAEWARQEALRDLLPEGAKWFPLEGGIQWEGEMYFPADYVMTRSDIQAIIISAREQEGRHRLTAMAEAWDAGAEMVLRAEGVENVKNALENLAENGHSNPYRKVES